MPTGLNVSMNYEFLDDVGAVAKAGGGRRRTKGTTKLLRGIKTKQSHTSKRVNCDRIFKIKVRD